MLIISGPLDLFGFLLQTTYKGSVAIIIVALAVALLGSKLGAKARYALWLLVLLRLALPATLPSSWSVFNLMWRQPVAMTAPLAEARLRVATPHGTERPVLLVEGQPIHPGWKLACGVWLSGALLLLMYAVISSVRLQRSVRQAARRSEVDPLLLGSIAAAARELGIRQRVRVVVSEGFRTPALHGLLRPTLLLPAAVVERFDPAELRHIILHELWHLRRFDVAVNWLLVAAQAIHWFNPLVWFAAARVREEREIRCDELALSCLEEDERSGYGTTILKLLEGFRTAQPVPALVGIVNPKQQMKRRLIMIASFQKNNRVPLLFVGVLAVVGVTAFTDPAAAGEGQKIMFRHAMDPAAQATMEKMHQRLSLSLTNATFGEVINAVAANSGVLITQSPEVATSKIQQARFTIDATDVPGHLILMHALMPFELMLKPGVDGVTILGGSDRIHAAHAGARHAGEAATEGGRHVRKHVVMLEGGKSSEEHDVMMHDVTNAGNGDKRLIVRSEGFGGKKLDADGKLHSEFTVKFSENGVTTEGKLKMDIESK